MLENFKKGIAVFMSCLIVFAIFSVYSFESVSAAEIQESPIPESCCTKTSDDQYCISTEVEIVNCEDTRTGSCDLVSNCDLGTCVSASGECLSDYPKAQCEENGGVWSNQEERNVAACRLGCCKDTLERGVMQKAECPGEFEDGLTDPMECRLAAAPETLGCCVESNSCTYQKIESGCEGTFFEDQYCYERDFCNARYESHAYTSCGDAQLISYADQDVFWFDSKGNMEELIGEVDRRNGQVRTSPNDQETGICNYPDEICFDPDKKGGRENAYCKSNDCVTDCPNCEPNSFKHGESMCLRIFEGQYTNDKRSNYLEESIIYCDKGEVKSESPLIRSEKICIDGSKFIEGDDVSRMYAKTINNNWEACGACGEGGEVLDYGGYIPVLGSLLISFGSWCAPEEGNWFYGTVPPGTLEGGETCESLGNTQGMQMCYYDGDLWAPMGSCNPIYPPADNTVERCNLCGEGGDSATNICTEQECNALGDCYFEKGNTGSGMLAAGAVALGTVIGVSVGVWAVCKAATAIIVGAPGLCEGLSATSIAASASTNLLYWGVFGLTVGLMGASNQGYEEFDEYGYSFENEDGGYNLASMIAMARAIDYALGDDDSISQGSDESEVSEDMNYIADSYGGTLNLLAAYFSTTIAGNIAGAMSAGAEGSLVREFFGWNTYLEGRFIQVMNVIGPVISVYSVSESFNTGNCVPETAYTNSDHCGECGGLEGQFICSENRCGILGADKDYCEWESKEDGGNDGVCLPSDPLDTSVPSINYMGFKMLNADGIFIDEMETSGHTMETQEFGWYDANTVRLNITLDEESKCRGSFEDEKDFEDMGEYKFEGRYTFDHTLEFNLTGQQKMHGENTFYIKCTDVNGNVNRQNDDINWIKILFGEEPNEVPPEIVDIDPDNRIMLPEGTNQIDLRIIVEDRVDEVTECKYGYNISNYEDLPNSFNRDGSTSCPGSSLPNDCYQFSNDFEFNEEDSVIFELEGYDGNATVYPYIFGCIDDYGNSKLINYSFTVYPGFDMNITSPEEGDRIYDSTPDLNISLGIIANCEYKIDNSPEWIEFGPSVNAELEDPLSGSVAGNSHTIAVKCRDLAYNEVEKSVNFVVLSDESGPSMTRLYTRGLFGSGGNLYIALNEESECAFNDEESFDFEDGTLMLPVHPRRRIGNGDNQKILSNEHASNWNSLKYYIKCRDEWENEASFVVYP